MTNNPMREARAALAKHPSCGAHCRTTGEPCKGPAMANGRCRMHGGASKGAPRGKKHGMYKHGRKTIEAQSRRQAWRAIERELKRLTGEC